MFAPPVELKKRCEKVLMRCSEFGSNADVQDIFLKDEKLFPFLGRVPEASNRESRVSRVLAYLLSLELHTGELVLPIFLRALQERYANGTKEHKELSDLADAFAPYEMSALCKKLESFGTVGSLATFWRNLLPDTLYTDYDFRQDFKSGRSFDEVVASLLMRCEDSAVIRNAVAETVLSSGSSVPSSPGPPPESVATSDPYTEMDIDIHSQSESAGGYPVRVTLSDGDHYAGTLRLDDAMRQALVEVGSDPKRYGHKLFDALFSGPIGNAYAIVRKLAERQTAGRLRIRLRIDRDAAELHALAWERLHCPVEGDAFRIATVPNTPFSRYIGLESADPKPLDECPLRMLFVISNPTGVEEAYTALPLNVEKEVSNLLAVFQPLQQAGQVQVTIMPGMAGLSGALRGQVVDAGFDIVDGVSSLDRIVALLTQGSGYHIIHYLGHGTFNSKSNEAALLLENKAGRTAVAKDSDIAERLRDTSHAPHLIFLAACESARREPGDLAPFVGLAPKLVQIGVPAVLAMQEALPMVAARALTECFYDRLLAHGVVDVAANQARAALVGRNDTSWSTPVLFTRLKDNRLFLGDAGR